MDQQKINIWELGTKVNVKLRIEFIDRINAAIKTQFGTKRKIHAALSQYYDIPWASFRLRMKRGYRYFVDLEIFYHLCKLLDIPLNEFQANILSYKTRKGWNCIEQPKLPIEITPVFDMLVAHNIGDGTVINCGGNRKLYFGYRQFDHHYRNLYLRKIEAVFGKVRYRSAYPYSEHTTRIYSPIVCSELMFKLYGLTATSFKSEIARIPKEIFTKDWRHKLAFLIGIIIDEGNIDSCLIAISMKNEPIITDLQRICNDLGYRTTMRKKGTLGMYCLYILSKSLPKFYSDYELLISEYPEVDLGKKGAKILEFLNRMSKPKLYIEGNKPKLLVELTNGALTVNELAQRLNMTRQGARYLVNQLIQENKLELQPILKFGKLKFGTHKYGLKVI